MQFLNFLQSDHETFKFWNWRFSDLFPSPPLVSVWLQMGKPPLPFSMQKWILDGPCLTLKLRYIRTLQRNQFFCLKNSQMYDFISDSRVFAGTFRLYVILVFFLICLTLPGLGFFELEKTGGGSIWPALIIFQKKGDMEPIFGIWVPHT